MANKTMRMKMDINNFFRLIDEVISNSRSKIARENGFGIAVGMEMLSSYLRQIAERAIELNDDVLLDLLVDLHVLKEVTEDGENDTVSVLRWQNTHRGLR